MKRPFLSQTLATEGFAALSGACLYLYVELSHVNRDLNATADPNTVHALIQRLDKMQEQVDGFAAGKPAKDERDAFLKSPCEFYVRQPTQGCLFLKTHGHRLKSRLIFCS